MKIFITLVLISYSSLTFAKCQIQSHKEMSLNTINSLIDIQMTKKEFKHIEFSNFSKYPDFGVKEEQVFLATGEKDIFNEDITKAYSTLFLYENGKVIYSTLSSNDYKKIVTDILNKIVELNCN